MTGPQVPPRGTQGNGQGTPDGTVPTVMVLPLNPLLGLLPRATWNRRKDYFTYTADFLPLAAGGTNTVAIQVQNDSDFLISYGVATVTETDNTSFLTFPAWPFSVFITDTVGSRNFSDRPVALANVFGTGNLPAVWPYPKLVTGGTSLLVQLNSADPDTAYNVHLNLVGFKVFWNQMEPG